MPNPENIEPHKMKKGMTLNPNGRPKGSKNRSTIARHWLDVNQKLKNPLTGQDEVMSQEDLMTLALIKKAREGDVNAYKALLDSGYGAPTQQIDTTILPVQINVGITSDDSNDDKDSYVYQCR